MSGSAVTVERTLNYFAVDWMLENISHFIVTSKKLFHYIQLCQGLQKDILQIPLSDPASHYVLHKTWV